MNVVYTTKNQRYGQFLLYMINMINTHFKYITHLKSSCSIDLLKFHSKFTVLYLLVYLKYLLRIYSCTMVIEGCRQGNLNLVFVQFSTRQQCILIILRELILSLANSILCHFISQSGFLPPNY